MAPCRWPPTSDQEREIFRKRGEYLDKLHDQLGGEWYKNRRVFTQEMLKQCLSPMPGEYWIEFPNGKIGCVAVEKLIDGEWMWVTEMDEDGNYDIMTRADMEHRFKDRGL